MQCALILHNIRSVHNVGSIFRTADAAGVTNIYLSGYTPTPMDRFGRMRNDLAKVALGAEKAVAWEHAANLSPLLRKLKKQGYLVLAIEQAAGSTPLCDYRLPKNARKLAIVLGNEVRGLSTHVLKSADHILEIPMHGKKESLNVSVTTGIALFTLLR